MRSIICLAGAALALGLSISACGSDDDSKFNDGKGTLGSSGDGGTSGLGSSGNGSNGGPGGLEDGGACAAGNADGARGPGYLFFILDVSLSMGLGDAKAQRWVPITSALTAFLQDPASAGVQAGLELFPSKNNECATNGYATTAASMDVPMGPIDSNSATKYASVWPATPNIPATPTKAVISSIGPIAVKWADEHKDGKTAIVLLTDGYPQSCNATDDKIETVATEIRKYSDKVPVYVIGISDVNLSDLQQLADAGKTQLTLIDAKADPAVTKKAFLDRINQIRTTTQSCDVTIPPPPAGLTLDLNKLNVIFTHSDGTKEGLAYDESCSTGSRKAWHFDSPTNPTKISLCTMTCDVFEADPASKVTVEFGCQRHDVVK